MISTTAICMNMERLRFSGIVLFVDVERRCLSRFRHSSSDHLDHSPITECRRPMDRIRQYAGNSSKPRSRR